MFAKRKCILGSITLLLTNAFTHKNWQSLKDCLGAMQTLFEIFFYIRRRISSAQNISPAQENLRYDPKLPTHLYCSLNISFSTSVNIAARFNSDKQSHWVTAVDLPSGLHPTLVSTSRPSSSTQKGCLYLCFHCVYTTTKNKNNPPGSRPYMRKSLL